MPEFETSPIPNPDNPQSREWPTTQEKLAPLISAVGNHELKALTLSVMHTGVIYTDADLRKSLTPDGKGIAKGQLGSYCGKTFAPIGLVAKEVLDNKQGVIGYMLTQYGDEVGISLDGLLLRWSLNHLDQSLYYMFGGTNSPKPQGEENEEVKRAASTRLKILWELGTNPAKTLRQVDLSQATGEQQYLIGKHLQNLAKSGVINYQARKADQPFSYYKLSKDNSEDPPSAVSMLKTLTQEIYQVLKEEPERTFSLGEVETLLREKYDDCKDSKGLAPRVSLILTEFARNGRAKRLEFSHESQSIISLTDPQGEAISSLINILDKFQRGDTETVKMGRLEAKRISSDPQLVETLRQKAAEASPHANRRSIEDTQAMITSIVRRNSGITNTQIMEALSKEYNRKLSKSTMHNLLLRFVKQRIIQGQREKSAIKYTIPQDN